MLKGTDFHCVLYCSRVTPVTPYRLWLARRCHMSDSYKAAVKANVYEMDDGMCRREEWDEDYPFPFGRPGYTYKDVTYAPPYRVDWN